MRKFLIINRLGIGDVVLTTPLAQIIKENIPKCKIGFLVANKSVDILKNHPYIDDVFAYKNKHEKKALIEQIKAKEYNEAIIVDGRLSSTILAWKSNCKLLNKGFCISINKKHIFERKNLAVKAIEDFATYAKTLLNIDYDKNKLIPKIGNCDKGKDKIISAWINEIKKQKMATMFKKCDKFVSSRSIWTDLLVNSSDSILFNASERLLTEAAE